MSSCTSRLAGVHLETFDPRGPILGVVSQPLESLDEALKHLQFEEKERFLETSKSCLNTGGPLTLDEKRAIFLYTCQSCSTETSFYVMLNGSLRDPDRSTITPFLPYINLLNAALMKKMVKIKRTLWCGVDVDLYEIYISKIGETIPFWGYTSTTAERSALDKVIPITSVQRTHFSILANTAADIGEESAFSEENEMLIAAGTVFKVVNVFREATNLTIVELEEVENLLGVSAPASPTTPSDGVAAAAGSEGEAAAMLGIYEEGVRHEEGTGVIKDLRRARECYEAAARCGHAPAQCKIGLFLFNGWGGLAEDRSEAVRYYRMAAEQGDAGGQRWLGMCHLSGHGGLEKDAAEAARWFRRAADQGHAGAQASLGFCCGRGLGVGRDDAEAGRLLRLAAGQDADAWARHNAVGSLKMFELE